MKRILFLITICASLVFSSCIRNAVTGRNQLSLVSESDLQSMALVQYKEFLTTNKPAGGSNADMVKRVGNRVAIALQQYYASKGLTNPAANYSWEFNLVENKEVNAWCMPGGKVVVYSGILPVTQTETGLAIVLGHEITHAIFGHGKERMSQQLAAEGLGALGGAALGGNAKAANIFNNVYGVTAQYGALLPNSRKQELEADHYGLIFAASAGYNPAEAVDFWTRMANLSQGQKTPAFFSDHPSDEDRINQIRKVLPEAQQYYKPR